MDLPTEWFESGSEQFALHWRVDEDFEVEIYSKNHKTAFLDSGTVAHMSALQAQAKREHEE